MISSVHTLSKINDSAFQAVKTNSKKVNVNDMNILISSLSKILGIEISMLGMDNEMRDATIIKSYIKLFIERYNYVKNLSVEMTKHHDNEFFGFVKKEFFNGVKPKNVNLPELTDIDINTEDADVLLYDLLSIVQPLLDNKEAYTVIHNIFKKINDQEERRKLFNFAKLKSTKIYIEEEEIVVETNPDEEDEEENLFEGYDMDYEDEEDNLNGEV
jgi:hypothetical protein